MERNRKLYIIFILLIALIAVIFKHFDLFSSSNIEMSVDNNSSVEIDPLPIVPPNYSLERYELVEILPQDCNINAECETPMNYLIRSNCPYTSLCLKNKCSVVCPNPNY